MFERMVKYITKNTKKLYGEQLLNKYCSIFNKLSNSEYVFISKINTISKHAIILYSSDNQIINQTHSLLQKPFPDILKNKKHHIEKNSYQFQKRIFEYYFGIPILNKQNEIISMLSIVSQKPINIFIMEIIDIFIDRIKSEQESLEQKFIIKNQQYTDNLTGMKNRAAFSEQIYFFNKSSKYNSVIFIDVDDFKTINESLGHYMGDHLLKKIGNELFSILETEQEIFRMGGDEFAIIIATNSDSQEESEKKAISFAKKIKDYFYHPICIEYHEIIISLSIGIFCFSSEHTVNEIIKYADVSLYSAKASGRNTFRLYNSEMKHVTEERLNMKNNLIKSIQQNELSIVLQPQFDNDGLLYGAEALSRWNLNGKFISPIDFIPLAEETGLIKHIGRQVLEKSCAFFEKEQYKLPNTFRKFSINVSTLEFYQPDFVKQFISIFEKFKLKPEQMEIEITESVFLKEQEENIKKMYQLVDYGFTFAVDDFGTGYSSLSYLIDLPFSKLKIDRAFVQRISESDRYQNLIESIINICNNMEFDVIAEGVETKNDFEFLKNHNCKYYQGFYFSKPINLDDFKSIYCKGK